MGDRHLMARATMVEAMANKAHRLLGSKGPHKGLATSRAPHRGSLATSRALCIPRACPTCRGTTCNMVEVAKTASRRLGATIRRRCSAAATMRKQLLMYSSALYLHLIWARMGR